MVGGWWGLAQTQGWRGPAWPSFDAVPLWMDPGIVPPRFPRTHQLAACRQLEIFQNSSNGGEKGSLMWVLDHTLVRRRGAVGHCPPPCAGCVMLAVEHSLALHLPCQ